MHPVSAVLAVSLLAASLPAQTKVVIPNEAAKQEGDGLSAVPFYTDRCRSSQYYGGSLLRNLIPEGKTITEIAYRRDGRALNTLLMRHLSTPRWTIRMGRYTLDAKNPSTRYLSPGSTANTLTTVFIKEAMSLPDLPGGAGPMEFRILFKLDRPFVYRGDALVVDHYVYETRNRTFEYYVDAVRKSADHGSYTTYGKACPTGKNRASAVPSNPGGAPFSLLLLGARPSAPALAVLGVSRTAWGAFQLPFDLSVLGMTGCSLYASGDLMLPTATFTTGGGDLSFEIPEDPNLAGAKLFGQWIVVDPQINPLAPLTTSNGVAITLGRTLGKTGAIDGAMVYGVNTLARSTYGFLDAGLVLVTEFTWQ